MLVIKYRKGVVKLIKEYEGVIKEHLRAGLRWRGKIEGNMLSKRDREILLRDIVKQLLVQGRSAGSVEKNIRDIDREVGEWSIDELERVVGSNSLGLSKRKLDKLKDILRYIRERSISDWILGLHEGRSDVPRMGPKSDDDFLKDHGFYEHVPIDRHSQRFLFRTGILHWYLKRRGDGDGILALFSLEYERRYRLFQEALAEFCKTFCKGIEVVADDSGVGLELAGNPGIIDIAIWNHCSRLGICGKEPKCVDCVFRESCLYYLVRYG